MRVYQVLRILPHNSIAFKTIRDAGVNQAARVNVYWDKKIYYYIKIQDAVFRVHTTQGTKVHNILIRLHNETRMREEEQRALAELEKMVTYSV